jgi:hypothetical protein
MLGSTPWIGFTGTEAFHSITVVSGNSGGISNFTNAYPMCPISVYSETGSAKGRAGRVADIWAGSAGVPSGSTFPVSPNDKEFVQFGQLIIPWNGTAPLIT